jgi:hypothetical protein
MRVCNLAAVLADGSQPPVPSVEEVIQSVRQIDVARGEDITIATAMTYQNGDDVVFGVNDEATLSLWSKTTDVMPVFTVGATLEDGVATFVIASTDLATVAPGRYVGTFMAVISGDSWAYMRAVVVVT